MEEDTCSSSTTPVQTQKPKLGKGNRPQKTEFDIINERVRMIHPPLIDLKPLKYEEKFLGRYRLYVSNLSASVTKEDLRELFKTYGEVNDVFIQPNKNFAFIRMDYYHNALRAKKSLNSTALKDKRIYVTFSPQSSIIVKHLSPVVTNELLHLAFSIFGEVEYCCVLTDRRGKPIGEGIVDFVKKGTAAAAKKHCSEKMFFITSTLKPVSVEDYVPPPDTDGYPEEFIRKNQQLFEERDLGPRFAVPGSFEYEYAKRFRDLWNRHKTQFDRLKAELENEERKLELDLMRAKYDHETERLKDVIRQRELEKERRFCQKLEYSMQNRDSDNKVDFNPPDNLFMQANQLNNILDNEEREIQEQWRMAEEFRTEYEDNSYQRDRYYDSQKRRKIPEVIVHCQKRQRFQ